MENTSSSFFSIQEARNSIPSYNKTKKIENILSSRENYDIQVIK